MNLPEVVQLALNYPPLLKFNVNTQDIKENKDATEENKFSQAAIPTVLLGLYKYTLTDDAAQAVLSSDISSNWVKEIFPGYNFDVAERIASYSGEGKEYTHEEMNKIAQQGIIEIRKAVSATKEILAVKNFMAAQRSNIYPYLPEALHIGTLINDTTVDDKTKKMEGPVSNLIKAIGDAFSSPDKDETIKKEV